MKKDMSILELVICHLLARMLSRMICYRWMKAAGKRGCEPMPAHRIKTGGSHINNASRKLQLVHRWLSQRMRPRRRHLHVHAKQHIYYREFSDTSKQVQATPSSITKKLYNFIEQPSHLVQGSLMNWMRTQVHPKHLIRRSLCLQLPLCVTVPSWLCMMSTRAQCKITWEVWGFHSSLKCRRLLS